MEKLAELLAAHANDADVSEKEIVLLFGERSYRMRPLGRNLVHDVMKINFLAACCRLSNQDWIVMSEASCSYYSSKEISDPLAFLFDFLKLPCFV